MRIILLCSLSPRFLSHLPAYVSIFVYGLGTPAVYAFIIFRSAGGMKVDQALRIRGLSGARDTNPFYDMQKRFKRLYFKFRPEMYVSEPSFVPLGVDL